MRILFTGTSSFTGFWLARELAAAGHEVVSTFQQERHSYSDTRADRIDQLLDQIVPIWNCSFGDNRFSELIHSYDSWDLFCHHAADVTNYKSADFDVLSAVRSNTSNVREVLMRMRHRKCGKVLVTGSVFEPGEGAGSEGLPAFSPYGLSKSLSWQILDHYCAEAGLPIAKFVIPNPFGPFEEARFTAYLINAWKRGDVAKVNTPEYVRDNIHVSLLAKAYLLLAEGVTRERSARLYPSGYIESQGQFALRVAAEMRHRSSLACDVELLEQTQFAEPRIRINTDVIGKEDWNESSAWDDFCSYYMEGNN